MWVFPFTSLEPWAPGGSRLLQQQQTKQGSRSKRLLPHKSRQRRTCAWCGLQLEIRVSPVRHGRGDVSVVQSGMPRKQDNASVAKHAVQKQLRRAQQVEMGWDYISRRRINKAQIRSDYSYLNGSQVCSYKNKKRVIFQSLRKDGKV